MEQINRPKKMIFQNSVCNIINFRSGIINKLIQDGHEVVAVGPPDYYVDKLDHSGTFLYLERALIRFVNFAQI